MSIVSTPTPEVFSTEVRLTLRTTAGQFSLGQIAPDYIILHPLHQLPPGTGEIILSINGRERVWEVDLPEGSSPTKPRTAIRRA